MRIVSWDIETTDLNADMGRVLCCSFCPITREDIVEDAYTLVRPIRTKDPLDDSALVREIKSELSTYHLVVGWNSKLFDRSFLNARLLRTEQDVWTPQLHIDLMYYAKGDSAKIGSARLDNVAKFFKTGNRKVDVDKEDWQRARCGNTKALENVVEHCESDVKMVSELYWRLLPNIRTIHRGG